VFNHAKLLEIEYKALSFLMPFAMTHLCECRFSSLLHNYRNCLDPATDLHVDLSDLVLIRHE